MDLPQSMMRPGSQAEVGREEERDYFWGLRSASELPEEVMMAVNHLGTLNQDERGPGRRGADCMEPTTAACSGSTLKRVTTVEGRGGAELQDTWAEMEAWSQHTLSDCCCEPQKLPRLCPTKSSCGVASLMEARAHGGQPQNHHLITVFTLQRYDFAHSINLLGIPLSCVLVIRD